MWKGTAAILKKSPAASAIIASMSIGLIAASAVAPPAISKTLGAITARFVDFATPNSSDMP